MDGERLGVVVALLDAVKDRVQFRVFLDFGRGRAPKGQHEKRAPSGMAQTQQIRRARIGKSCRFDVSVNAAILEFAGWSSLVARWAHNPKVVGSNPTPATKSLLFGLGTFPKVVSYMWSSLE